MAKSKIKHPLIGVIFATLCLPFVLIGCVVWWIRFGIEGGFELAELIKKWIDGE